jgi:hypothetical protein
VLLNAEDVVINAFAAKPTIERVGGEHWISLALLDLSDEVKARVAALAEEKGEVLLAAVILSTMIDQQRLKDLVARTSDAALLKRIAVETVNGPILVGNLPLRGSNGEPLSAEHKKWFEVGVAAAKQPEGDFLYPFMHQTGLLVETHKAAMALRAAIEDGTVRRTSTHDAAWLLVYRALIGASEDDGRIDEALRGFTAGAVRAGRRSIAGEIDRIIAIEALRPYVRGETDTPPQMPEGPGGMLAAEWTEWLALAELVRNSSLVSDPGSDVRSLTMAAELLFAAGKVDALAIMLAGSPPTPNTVALATDFAQRLDRGCASYLWHPGEALAGVQIYKFDGAGQRSGP